ncbi:MAG: thiamine pyrophosphokinase [Rhodospirillales bacterium 20-64-7]|nr:MAG: thiamine pyrophosphokinase [Rhodospirillales bacterium 20-64-7]
MACDPKISKLLSHIQACRSATLPGGRLKFYIGNHHVGYVWPDFARTLAGVSADMDLTDRLVLAANAAPRFNEIAAAAGARVRFENFDVREAIGGPVLAVLDRGALPSFGVIGVGAHLNGLVQRPDGWHLWVAKRAANKKLDPNKLDHLVAGGVAAGHTPFETLVKESEEEAALPAALAAQARQVGCFAYNMERLEGLRRDVIYAYDLVLPEDFVPQPADGEVESFALWPLAAVFERVCASDDFKFNVNLVLIDLFIRFGLVTGEDAAMLRAALNPA